MNCVFIRFYVVLLYHCDNIVLVEFLERKKYALVVERIRQSKTCKGFSLDRSQDWTETAIARCKALSLDGQKHTVILYYYSIFENVCSV